MIDKQPIQKDRYKKEIFPAVKMDSVPYARHISFTGHKEDLYADIYSPKADSETNRPALIFLHGGAFTSGSRKSQYMVDICRSFAKRGYVTVSLSYRLGVADYFNPVSYGEAVYRGVQDARAAVRYFRANAEKYGIDGNKIFIGGGSAGAIVALHTAYWQQNDVPKYLDAGKLGPLDITDAYGAYSSAVAGVINCWGAVIDTGYIRKGAAPLVSIHGEKDEIVPYRSASLGQFSLSGSYYIHERAKHEGVYSVLKPLPDTGHGLSKYDKPKWDATVNTISDFLYQIITENKS
jgi:acetyl esterase/lipase